MTKDKFEIGKAESARVLSLRNPESLLLMKHAF